MGYPEGVDWSGTASITFGVAFYAPIGALALAVLGLLWAPAGTLILSAVARLRRLKPAPYAAAGAKASALALLPWVYLFIKLAVGRPPPALAVKAAYMIVYAVWLCIIAVTAYLAVSYIIWLIQGKHVGLSAFAIALNGAVAATCAYAFSNSVRKTRGRGRRATREIAAAKTREDALMPESAYLRPFGWLIVWSLIYAAAMIALFLANFTEYG